MSDRLSQLVKTLSLESEEMQDVPMEQEGLDVPEEQAEFEQAEHENLDEVRESETLSDQLDTLSGQVEEAPEGAALEHYHWMMSTLLSNAKMPTTKSVALENFTNSDSGKALLAKGIKSYNGNLKRAISVALEAYVDNYAGSVSEQVEKYKTSTKILKETMAEFKEAEVVVKISSKKIWEMFHVNGKFIDQNSFIADEVGAIAEMVKEVEGKLAAIIKNPGSKVKLKNITKHLMFNRTVNISASGCTVDEKEAPKFNAPVNAKAVMVLAGVGIVLVAPLAFLSMPALSAAAATLGLGAFNATMLYVGNKLRSVANTVNLRKKKSFITEVTGLLKLEDNIDTLDKAMDKFSMALSKMETEDVSKAKREAAPLVETISFLIKHINDLTSGFSKVFDTKLSSVMDYTEDKDGDGKRVTGVGKNIFTGETTRRMM